MKIKIEAEVNESWCNCDCYECPFSVRGYDEWKEPFAECVLGDTLGPCPALIVVGDKE